MPRRRQQGVAVITALLLTTLAITIVASLFWQQQVQVRSMENQRLHLQTRWVALGMADFARFWLREDFSPITTLNDIWAKPIEEAQLDDYIDREREQGEKFNATVSGRATDAQARYNLTNLMNGKIPDPKQLLVFQRLLTNLQLDSGLAQAVQKMMADTSVAGAGPDQPNVPPGEGSQSGGGGGSALIGLTQVEDLLAVPGMTPQVLDKLRDFVIVLPVRSKVNVNTAPAEVLAALGDVSLSEANTLVVARQRTPFISAANFTSNLGKPASVDVDVKSDYFLASILVKLDRAVLNAQALIQRTQQPTRTTKMIWMREY
nr:type II secretion system minor pseudopilin GspK [Janthinobacterium agaricidamnosum]